MKNYRIIFLIGLPLILIASCKDIFEVSNSSFVKIYGENLNGGPIGFFQKDDGGFVIYGDVNKNIDGGGFIATKPIPTIIVTDKFGNQTLSREYPLGDFQYQQNQASFIEWEIDRAYFISMIPLANGNYFATIRVQTTTEPLGIEHIASHFVILDKNFNIMKYGIFNDHGANLSRIHFIPWVYRIPDSDDIIILMRTSRVLNGLEDDLSTAHYAIIRMSIDGEILKIGEIENRFKIWAIDLTFDDSGNIVVTGYDYSAICITSFIDVIDINDLQLIKSNTFSLPGEWHIPAAIEKIDGGYVVQDVSIDGACSWLTPDNPNAINSGIGSIWFYDNDITVANTKRVEVVNGISDWDRLTLTQTEDGGFVVGYTQNIDNEGLKSAIIIKTDKDGVPLWSYREPRSFMRAGIIETSDGGIVFIALKILLTKMIVND